MSKVNNKIFEEPEILITDRNNDTKIKDITKLSEDDLINDWLKGIEKKSGEKFSDIKE